LGILVTAILFGMTIFAYFPAVMVKDTVFVAVGVGILAGLFFFAVRDVYATTIVVGGCSVFMYADGINPQYLDNIVPGVWISAGLAACSLIIIHLYLARNFTTIRIPDK
jgi:mannitol-specific phosphotransferase system IIBC component